MRRAQGDAIVLNGGCVFSLVFRGDNTAPIYVQKFSPLHNRCLELLSKLQLKGHEGYWDSLYPSFDVCQEIAKGGTYEAVIPAGPRAGQTAKITVPPTGMCGTARTNRGIAPSCRQPDKQGLSKKALEELKAKPIEERVKSAMSATEPRVLCASVFDNGPVHMLDTIHTSAGIITVHKPMWNAETKSVEKVPRRILALIDKYNHGMCYVDNRDQLSNSYEFDGGFWRDRKWWMPVFKELFKSSCDQGYVMYQRVREIAEEKRQAAVHAAKEAWEAAAAKQRKSPRSPTKPFEVPARLRTKIEPMEHLDFMEKIAEGFVVEAYNSTKKDDSEKMSLSAYDLSMLERALAEMRGLEPPSAGARGAAGASGKAPKDKGTKRRLELETDCEGLLLPAELKGPEEHVLVDGQDAVDWGIIDADYFRESNFCAYDFCPIAARNKAKKSGSAIKKGQKQKGRARAGAICKHPKCKRFFHATCWAVAHRKMPRPNHW